jgi:plastocyanin/outer membrane protein assembly factor BamB
VDAKTGRELWRFFVVPRPGEPGHETWPQNNLAWEWGGASIWLAPVVDPDLGLVYYGTGNPDPITYSGEVRAGNNLFTCSVIALDMKTGKLKWYYQFMHHDLWEQDVATPLVLYDQQVNGRLHKGVGAMRPDGYLFLLDRETGKPLIPVHERPVPQDSFEKTAPTQPFPDGDSILRSCDDWKDKVPAGFSVGCFAAPSPKIQNVLTYGVEVRFVPMSFSPQTGYFYAQGKDQLVWFRRGDDPLMSQFGVHAAYNIDKYADSVLAAIDSRTNKVVWKKIVPMTNGYGPGGSLTTAGGLAFHRMGDGTFQAFDAKTGDLLWQFQTGHPLGDSSPITYELDGQQYVAISAATSMWAFRLGGTVPQAAAPPAPRPYEAFTGPIEDAMEIQTASLIEVNGHYWVDHTAFHPYRARVKAGVPVTFTNNGYEDHTLLSLDGSWTTGLLHPSETITLTFAKPGEYTYACKEHPWSYGQLIVVESAAPTAEDRGAAGNQVARGKDAYQKSCAACHMASLGGNGEAAPALVGNDFLNRWSGRTGRDLLDKISTTMPTGTAGSLTPQAYLDIVAYILQVNEIPAGSREVNAEGLKNLSLVK